MLSGGLDGPGHVHAWRSGGKIGGKTSEIHHDFPYIWWLIHNWSIGDFPYIGDIHHSFDYIYPNINGHLGIYTVLAEARSQLDACGEKPQDKWPYEHHGWQVCSLSITFGFPYIYILYIYIYIYIYMNDNDMVIRLLTMVAQSHRFTASSWHPCLHGTSLLKAYI